MTQTATFSRMDSAETQTIECSDFDAAQEIANIMGRDGWVLKAIEPTHKATVFYGGNTYSGNAKYAWVFTCNCGDEDATYTKTDVLRSAKAHAANVALTVYNRNGSRSK